MRNSFGMTVYEDKNVIEFKSPYLANKAFDILQKLHVLEAAQQSEQSDRACTHPAEKLLSIDADTQVCECGHKLPRR